MDTITEKPFSEIPADIDLFDPRSGWSWGFMSANYEDGHLDFIDAEFNTTRYKIPPVVTQMLQLSNRHTEEKVKRNIRNALGM